MLGRFGFVTLAIVTLALAAAASRAMTAEATIGDVSVNLPPPKGFCELTEQERLDKLVLVTMAEKMAKAASKLLGITADCRQLADWHANKRTGLADMVEYWTLASKVDKWTPPSAIDALCAVTRAGDGKPAPKTEQDIRTLFEHAAAEGPVGVIAEVPGICYTASLKLNSGDKVPTTQVTYHAYTVVRNKWVAVSRLMPYPGAEQATNGLTLSKADAAALIAANRN
jgi:hypothetical protein